ncbi:PEP-CTERM sorting domain-containing protein [Nitrosomonas sp.]|uniref:PEP-CTERM sorting domain-containing protein n=1 Tax=Nitrosomonas sp. TaxID=42353 RepID=UPI0033060840
MKQIKLASLLGAISLFAAAPASASVIGGVDFGALGESPSNIHLETATLAQQIVTGNGQNSTAYGFITSVNGNTNYCASGNCSLYYVAEFNNSQNYSTSYVEFANSTVTLYYADSSNINLLGQSSAANLAYITGLSTWVTLTGHNNLGGVADPSAVVNATGLFAGDTLTFTGNGLLDVNSAAAGEADVKAFLDANRITDAVGGKADIAFTSSANDDILNPFDNTSSCGTGTPTAGQWCFQGTSNIRGNTVTATVPEPATLALLAAGLGMLGFARKVKQA